MVWCHKNGAIWNRGTPKQTFLNEHFALFMLVQIVKLCHKKKKNSIKNQGFAAMLQNISFQNDSFILHRLNLSKGTLIYKNNTFISILNIPQKHYQLAYLID